MAHSQYPYLLCFFRLICFLLYPLFVAKKSVFFCCQSCSDFCYCSMHSSACARVYSFRPQNLHFFPWFRFQTLLLLHFQTVFSIWSLIFPLKLHCSVSTMILSIFCHITFLHDFYNLAYIVLCICSTDFFVFSNPCYAVCLAVYTWKAHAHLIN